MFAPVTRKHLVENLLRGKFPQPQLFRKIRFKRLKNSRCEGATMLLGFGFAFEECLGEDVLSADNGIEKKSENAVRLYFFDETWNEARENALIVQMLCRNANPNRRRLRLHISAFDGFFVNGQIRRLEQGRERIAFLRISGAQMIAERRAVVRSIDETELNNRLVRLLELEQRF
jgi:hypothetical protein